MPIVYIPPTNGPFFKVENPIFESKRARKIWLPLLLILGAVTVGGMFIGHFGSKKGALPAPFFVFLWGKARFSLPCRRALGVTLINHGTSAPCAAASASSDTAESR